MTKKIKLDGKNKRNAAILFVAFAIVGAIVLLFAKAATGTAHFSLSAISGSTPVSTNFTLSISETTALADPVGSVDVEISYNANELNYQSITTNGGYFTDCQPVVQVAGLISMSCYKLGSFPTGTQKVGEVTFSAKPGITSSVVSFANTSHIYRYEANPTDIWDQITTGGTYTFTTPDTLPPLVTSVLPVNNATVLGTSVPISATVTDQGGGTVSRVELWINNLLKGTLTNTSGSAYSINWDSTTPATPDTTYVMKIIAYDNATPTANATTITQNIIVKNNKPNLTVTGVTLSPAIPKPGDTVTVTATVTNNGTADLPAGSAVVSTISIDGAVKSTTAPDTTALAINVSRSYTYTWTPATIGFHDFSATTDINNQVAEVTEPDVPFTKTRAPVFKPGDCAGTGGIGDNKVDAADLAKFNYYYNRAGTWTYSECNFVDPVGGTVGIVDAADVAQLNFGWNK